MSRKTSRTQTAQSMIAFVLLIAFFIVAAIGIFAFEVNRIILAREQLRAACDSAALAAAAALASSDNTDPVDAHMQAMTHAMTTFQSNTVLGTQLSDASLAADASFNPDASQSALFVEFLDPHNNKQPVTIGDPRGKIVRISAIFGAEPAFGKFLGINHVPVRVISSGGVPDLDVVLCFDVSGSIDDQTPVTFVKRAWDPVRNRIAYTVVPTRPGAQAGPLAQGRLFDILGPRPTGTRVNALYPQYLANSSTTDVRWPLTFSERPSGTGSARGLRGAANGGSPPGNRPPGTSGTGSIYTYTDLVINIDGNTSFQGISADGYLFPDIGTIVEASRGNLENDQVFRQSGADTSLPYITPRPGYQQKYFELSVQNVHPLADAQQAARDFFTIMNTNTDGHFGLVAFSDEGGQSQNYTYTAHNVDAYYPQAGQGRFRIPQIVLDPAVEQTNYQETVDAVPQTVATTGTNIGDALLKAVDQLRTRSRPGAKKAIVLFTDGQPTVGGPLSGDPWTNARRAAVEAKRAGIPVYTIGLAQNSEIIPGEVAILNDTNSSPANGGIAAIAGNGGKFFLVTDVSNLRYTFENIARHLVQLVR